MKKLRNNARGYILDMFAQHHMVKRTVLSFLSIVIMGLVRLFSMFPVSA